MGIYPQANGLVESLNAKIISVLSTFSAPRCLGLEIQYDASQDAIGCCLLQNKKPVCFLSRSLTDTELGYAQIEKELLAVTFSCQKLHNLLDSSSRPTCQKPSDRKQNPSEPFDKYYTDLKELIKHCQFRGAEKQLLCTQIVLGIQNKESQQELLKKNMDLEQTVQFCQSIELSEKSIPLNLTISSNFHPLVEVKAWNSKLHSHTSQSKDTYHHHQSTFSVQSSNIFKDRTAFEASARQPVGSRRNRTPTVVTNVKKVRSGCISPQPLLEVVTLQQRVDPPSPEPDTESLSGESYISSTDSGSQSASEASVADLSPTTSSVSLTSKPGMSTINDNSPDPKTPCKTILDSNKKIGKKYTEDTKSSSPQDRNLPDTSKKKKNTRTSSDALTPPYTSKNRFAPLLTIQVDDNTDGIANEVSTQQSQVRPKIPPIYVYNISDYENFHTSLANITFDEFSIANTKSALKVNMDSIDDYRTATKLFDDSGIEYHTYQFPENKQLSVIIRNLPVNISETCIYKELVELKFEVASVTRLQNKFKTPIPIVAILLSKSSTEIYSLNILLHCVVTVEPRQPSKGIPQCTNCQRFSHTKKFCHLPPRCVKCAGDHHYSSCPKEIETPPKCVNCLSDHPASYRDCTFYKEISKSKKNATQFKNNYTKVKFPVNISNITQNDVTDKRSYAAATKNKSQDKSFNNTDNDFMKTLLPLINTFISQLLQKIIENLPAILNSVHLNPNGSP
ncbi:hypothetical protein QTP88_006062 [Uroleucon formosanum]